MDILKNLIQEVETLKSQQLFSAAIKLLEESIPKYNDDYRLYEEIADIYLYQGKMQKAQKAIDFALNINAESATGNYLKGFILLTKNKVNESISFLEKSNILMPNNSEVLRNLGWAYHLIGNTPRWIAILKRALVISPDDKLINEDLAMALIGNGHIFEGNEILKRIGKQPITL